MSTIAVKLPFAAYVDGGAAVRLVARMADLLGINAAIGGPSARTCRRFGPAAYDVVRVTFDQLPGPCTATRAWTASAGRSTSTSRSARWASHGTR